MASRALALLDAVNGNKSVTRALKKPTRGERGQRLRQQRLLASATASSLDEAKDVDGEDLPEKRIKHETAKQLSKRQRKRRVKRTERTQLSIEEQVKRQLVAHRMKQQSDRTEDNLRAIAELDEISEPVTSAKEQLVSSVQRIKAWAKDRPDSDPDSDDEAEEDFFQL